MNDEGVRADVEAATPFVDPDFTQERVSLRVPWVAPARVMMLRFAFTIYRR
jgi:hypothetical protein